MEHQQHRCTVWQRLFQRRRISPRSQIQSPVATYFVFLYGRRRSLLTEETVQELETTVEQRVQETDETSQQSFQSCVSLFEEDSDDGSVTPLCPNVPDQTFGHYISKSRIVKIAVQILEQRKMNSSNCFSVNEGNDEKYLSPGIGWEVRDDEQGMGVTSQSRFNSFNGMWRSDFECSDDASLMVDLMEMPWLYKKATKLIQFTQVVVTKEAFCMYAKALGLSFPTISYWSREGRMRPRRDLRKGEARVTTVPTTFGFRQYLQWGQPFAGFAIAEAQLSSDNDSFQIVNWIQRYDGPCCSIRSVFRRHQK